MIFSRLRPILLLALLLITTPSFAEEENLIPISVHSGTNLIHLARDYCVSKDAWKEVARINKLKAPYKIYEESTLFIPLSLLITEDLSARISSFHGEVKIKDQDGQIKTAEKNEHVQPGQTLITGDDSFAHLILADNKYTRVAPNSQFHINYFFRLPDKTIKADFDLNQGRITHNITKKLKFNESIQTRTPVSLTGIRGTEFRVKMIDEDNFIETLSGVVKVQTDASTIDLQKGQGVKIDEDLGIEPPRQLPDIPDRPTLQPVYRTLPISFMAPEHNTADFIRIRLCTEAGGTDTFMEMMVRPGEKFIIPSLADGSYYTFVTAIDPDKFESPANSPFTVKVRTIPAAPIVSEPKDGLITFENQVSSKWLKSEHVDYYIVQLSSDSTFTNLIEEITTKSPEYQSPELAPGEYHLRIQGVAADGFKTLYSPPVSWKISSQPKLENMEMGSGDDVKFQWSPMEEEGTYDLELSKTADFSHIIISESGLSKPFYQVEKELYPGEYFVRVRGVLKDGTPSQWTPPQILTIEKGPLGIFGAITIIGIILIALL